MSANGLLFAVTHEENAGLREHQDYPCGTEFEQVAVRVHLHGGIGKFFFLIPETNPDRPRRTHQFSIGIHGLHLANGFTNIHSLNSLIAQANHFAELTLRNCVHSGHTKASAENAVKRCRRTTTLNMAQHADANFLTRSRRNDSPNEISHTSTTAIFFQFRRKSYTLGHHNNGEVLAITLAGSDVVANALNGEGNFRNQNHVRAASNASFQCNPASVTAHDFHDHHTMMGLGSSVRSEERR